MSDREPVSEPGVVAAASTAAPGSLTGPVVLTQAERNIASLSKRQAQVLQLSGEGLTRDEIAAQLGVSLETAKTYLRWATLRLNARNRIHAAVLYAVAKERHG